MIAISYRPAASQNWVPPYYVSETCWDEAKKHIKQLEAAHGAGNARLEIVDDFAVPQYRSRYRD